MLSPLVRTAAALVLVVITSCAALPQTTTTADPVAAFRGQTNDLYLSRTLKAWTLVRADSRDAALALYSSGQADVFSGARDGESDYITRAPANRILPESFLDVPHAIALPKDRAAGLAFLAAFLNEVKASGLVADAIGRAGLASERVAP